MSLAIFDLDRTLLDIHSGFAWVRHELALGHIGFGFGMWIASWMMREQIGRSEGFDGVQERAIQEWAGQSEKELMIRSRRFAETSLVPRLRPGAREVIASHRARGDRMVMATASTTYLAGPIAERWGLELIAATELDVQGGRLTGKIARSALGGHKVARVQAWAEAEGIELSRCQAYTDSWHDEGLLDVVGYPVAVNPDRRLRQTAQLRNWVVVDWGRARRWTP